SHLKVEIHLQAQRAAKDWIIVGVVRDVTEREHSAERLHRLAHYDSVTGLPNRILFYQTLQSVLLQAAEKSWNVAVMCLDLDHFKNVNDTLGHASGDELLLQFSARLGGCVRAGDAVGRLGGDEFAMILVMHDGQAGAVVVANKIRDAMRAPYNLNGHEVAISGSIGIAVYPNDAQDSATLLKYADTALYQAKKAGRDTYRFFTAQMNLQVVARLALETALRHAVEHDEFVLHFQPKLDIDTGAISGAEALLRWQRPGVGLVMPDAFMLTLEETGLIVAVGRWVIATACKQIAEWLATPMGAVPISVNVSGRQFMEGDLYRDVITSIATSAIPAQLLELELTESSLMENTERTIACLANLKRRGVLISIDDFGTGYSSLAYLRRFPIDKLKIDMSFIRDVTSNPDAASIVLAIISMAHSLKLDVIAEGVETDAQLAYLRRHHCDEMQGHLFSPALPAAAMAALLAGGRGLPPPTRLSSVAQQAMLLVVSDNAQRLRLAGALRLDGVGLFCANSAARAFGLLAQHTVQVVACVHGEEGLDAVDFFERVRRLYPNALRLALSGSSNAQALAELVNRTGLHRLYPLGGDTAALQRDLRDCFRTVMQPHNRRLGDDDAQTVIDDPVPEPA
ncbi:MAG: EAL domain-containing protein, partial [Pseudomonadota bacterium]|nr:EAL domain-containing protein [Pseudomonadota bacterium]